MDLTKNIEDFNLVIFDLETTGLDVVTGDAICEVGAFKVRNRKIIDKFHSLVNPGRSMPIQAYNVHKISQEELKDAPYFEDIVDKFISFVGESIIYAYNIKFDIGFINNHLKKSNRPSLELPAVDILSMARDGCKLPRYNLEAVAKFLDIDCSQGLHRALKDALIAYQVLIKLLDIFKAKGVKRLDEFISLYGLNNEILQSKEEKKALILNAAIERKETLEIKYFSSDNTLEEEEVLPLRIGEEDRYSYLLCQGKSKSSYNIKLSRILRVGEAKSN